MKPCRECESPTYCSITLGMCGQQIGEEELGELNTTTMKQKVKEILQNHENEETK